MVNQHFRFAPHRFSIRAESASSPSHPAACPCAPSFLLNLIPNLGINARETIQVSQVGRRNGDSIAELAGERRLARKNRIGIEGIR